MRRVPRPAGGTDVTAQFTAGDLTLDVPEGEHILYILVQQRGFQNLGRLNTLAMLVEKFLRLHAVEKLAPKTIERYRQLATYLAPELLTLPVAEVTPLHLSRRVEPAPQQRRTTRRDQTPRPLRAKSVRHIAGLISSAFSRAENWGLVAHNPVFGGEPPVPKKH